MRDKCSNVINTRNEALWVGENIPTFILHLRILEKAFRGLQLTELQFHSGFKWVTEALGTVCVHIGTCCLVHRCQVNTAGLHKEGR